MVVIWTNIWHYLREIYQKLIINKKKGQKKGGKKRRKGTKSSYALFTQQETARRSEQTFHIFPWLLLRLLLLLPLEWIPPQVFSRSELLAICREQHGDPLPAPRPPSAAVKILAARTACWWELAVSLAIYWAELRRGFWADRRMFFPGDPSRRKRVALGGRSTKQNDRQNLVEQTRLERERRSWLRKQTSAAIKIQVSACFRLS